MSATNEWAETAAAWRRFRASCDDMQRAKEDLRQANRQLRAARLVSKALEIDPNVLNPILQQQAVKMAECMVRVMRERDEQVLMVSAKVPS